MEFKKGGGNQGSQRNINNDLHLVVTNVREFPQGRGDFGKWRDKRRTLHIPASGFERRSK